jgi:hypothetical protein
MHRWLRLALTFGVLGFVAGAVRSAEEAAAPPKPDPAAEAAYLERLKEVRLIEIRHLRAPAPAEFEKGRRKILDLKDEKSIGPMVSVLYGPNVKYRNLLIDALSPFAADNSKAAQAYLQDIAVGDGSAPNRGRAVDGLKRWSGDRPTNRLMAHLALDEVATLRDHAATALAALEEKHAVWLLVERLVTEDVRLVGADVWDARAIIDIRGQMCDIPQFRHSTVTAAVPALGIATATIDLPEVRVTDFKTTIGMADKGHIAPDYQRVRTEHPEILAALKSLTGKDFGFSQGAWQKWLETDEARRIVPPWEPVVVKQG